MPDAENDAPLSVEAWRTIRHAPAWGAIRDPRDHSPKCSDEEPLREVRAAGQYDRCADRWLIPARALRGGDRDA